MGHLNCSREKPCHNEPVFEYKREDPEARAGSLECETGGCVFGQPVGC